MKAVTAGKRRRREGEGVAAVNALLPVFKWHPGEQRKVYRYQAESRVRDREGYEWRLSGCCKESVSGLPHPHSASTSTEICCVI